MSEHHPDPLEDPLVEPIAVIGMACRMPGAAGIQQYWENLCNGVESISRFGREEALAAGAGPRSVDDPQHVFAAPILEHVEDFDAGLFGCTRREAEILDPQHRVLLECAWAALDHAGYDPSRYDGHIGVYTGVGSGEYQWYHLLPDKSLVGAVGHMAIALANNPDYASTLISYKLNLTGPSLSVSTACSTGLVAIHLACEAVRNGECDMALAGAASVELTQWQGYTYNDGGILSPDGHCRAFDQDAGGTLWGSGGGLVLLKRLSDALADGDTIHGVILGSAINNDGSSKVGFSAPSITGQAAVIRQALHVAGVDPSTIGYVEAHGTGTNVGDPIEVRALSQAMGTGRPGSCGIGSVKPNIGHLAAAAGAAGLIKAILALGHETIPPTLHFRRPNPAIELDSTRFRVVAAREAWPRTSQPRRAGVSSFGMGGTNAHAVIQEAPTPDRRPADSDPHVILLSARSTSALNETADALGAALRHNAGLRLDDVSFTLDVGRRRMPHRRAFVATDLPDAADVLGGGAPRRTFVGTAATDARTVFLLPGQGAQRVGMASELYQRYDVVRHWIDAGSHLLEPVLGVDLRDLLFANTHLPEAADGLRRTEVTQPAMFVVEFALAKLWESWGVRPAALLGHSLGEYVAAALAGVFDFEDGLRLVAARGALIASAPPGAMLATPLDVGSLQLDGTDLDLAAVNAPMATVVAGPNAAVEAYEEEMAEAGVPVTRLSTSHAFHSRMLAPLRPELERLVSGIALRAPTIPLLSNVTGTWLTAEQATNPQYWAQHMCATVCFADGLATVLGDGPAVLLEVGPGDTLTGLARMQLPTGIPDPIPTLPPRATHGEVVAHLEAAGRLWSLGIDVDFAASRRGKPARVPLPGHPFERQRYWIEADPNAVVPGTTSGAATLPEGRQQIDDWFWTPVWRQTPRLALPDAAAMPEGPWLVVSDPGGHVDSFVEHLRERGAAVATVTVGTSYAAHGYSFTLRATEPQDAERLLDDLAAAGLAPRHVVHAAALEAGADLLDLDATRRAIDRGFTLPIHIVQAMAARDLADRSTHLVLTCGAQAVTGDDVANAASAVVNGPLRSVPREFEDLTYRHIDVDELSQAAPALIAELAGDAEAVAYRRRRRWVPSMEQATVPEAAAQRAPVRQNGVYVITGGLGGIGLTLAEELARRFAARLVLVSRSPIPAREHWPRLAERDDQGARTCATLMRIERLGGQVLTVAADVSDADAVADVRDQAIAAFGRVDGVIHAAGIAGGTMTEVQSVATASAVLAPKVFGTLALATAFVEDTLDFFAACSSVTSLIGGLGQGDYCAANAYLDAFAHAASAQLRWPVLAVNWGAWLEIGMAVDAFTPTRPVHEAAAARPVSHPLLASVHHDPSGRLVGTVDLDAAAWVLDEHRVLGLPTLPGTAHLELVRATFAADRPGPLPVELRDVVFLNPMRLNEGERRAVRVVIDDVEGGGWSLASLVGTRWVEHSRGSIAWATPQPRPVCDLNAVVSRCPSRRAEDELAVSASGLVAFGAHWGNLSQVWTGDGEELARLEAPMERAGELSGFWLHPAILDEATAFGQYDGANGAYLPLGYGRVTVHAPIEARSYSHLVHRDGTGDLLASDITVLDERGVAVVEIQDFLLRRVIPQEIPAVDPGGAAATATEADGIPMPSAEDTAGSIGGDQVGIRPAEGAAVFLRALGSDVGPQVAITATHLKTLADKVSRDRVAPDGSDEAGAGSVGDQDVLLGEYVAPSTDLERSLVSLWEDTLGVRGVGVDHDFFDLGGNSLAAAQLIARIRAALGVKLPMRVIFASPTIAAMAPKIAAGIKAAAS